MLLTGIRREAGLLKQRLVKSRFYSPLAGSMAALVLVGGFIVLLQLLSRLTTPANALLILRAIVDVAGVLLGFSGILFANVLLMAGQDISRGRRELATGLPSVPLDSLLQYRRRLVNSLLSVYFLLILSVISSLAMMTYITDIPTQAGTYALVSTAWALGISLYFLVAGIGGMALSLVEAPP